MSTSEPAISTPIVPTTMRWIHSLAASAECDSAAVTFQRKAKTNARTPIEPTRAWPMWIQLVIRTSGLLARKLGRLDANRNPAC